MAVGRKCPRCGTEVKGETLDGLCPECLLREALCAEGQADPDERAGGSELATVRVHLANENAKDIQPKQGSSRFGDYELLEVIAHGGMGMVYKARQVSLNRLVALKMLLFGAHSSPAAVQRLRAEAIAAASLHHPNIVAIHEVGFCEGQHFLAMDYVEGRPLSALMAGKPLPPKRAATYLRTIAEAVHHAHEHGILHRDLKPSNILIDQEDQPRITDFGLAKRLESDSNLTVSGQVLGSPNYMSPEQAGGKRGALTRRSDIYSLGAMLYELLTGRPPFIGEGLAEIVPQVLNNEPLAPRALNPSVPLDLQTVCLKCLEKEQEKRYPTASAVAEELGRFLEGKPVLARPVGRVGKTWRWCRRKPVVASLTAAVVLIFVLGFAGVLWQWRSAEQQRQAAQANGYDADINLAQHALEAGDLGLAIRLLDRYQPSKSLANITGRSSSALRHWEWRYLRQLCQGDDWLTLHRYPSSVFGLQASSDGKFLAVRKGLREVAVWDLERKRSLAELTAPALRWARNCAFVPRTALLAIGSISSDGQPEVAVWDGNLCQEKERFRVTKPVRMLAISPGGEWLAIFHEGGGVSVLEIASKRVLQQFPAPPGPKSDTGDISFSRDGDRLIIGQTDGRINVIEWRTGETLLEIPAQDPDHGVLAMACSPTEDLVAWTIGYGSTAIWLWDFGAGKALGEFEGHTDWVTALAFSTNGQLLASASADQSIRLWDVAHKREVRRFQGHPTAVVGVTFLPDGKTLVSAGEGSVRLWNLTATNLSRDHTRLPAFVQGTALTFLPDGQNFITVNRDHSAKLWRTAPVKELGSLSFLGTNVLAAVLSPDGHWLAAADASGILRVWDWNSRRVVTNLPIYRCDRAGISFSARSKYLLASVLAENGAWVHPGWETTNWKPLPNAPEFVEMGFTSAAISPNEREWAVGHKDGKIKLWTLPASEELTEFRGHSGEVIAMAFSADGRMLASAGADGYVNLYDTVTRRPLDVLRAHSQGVRGVCFSPDGRRLATLSNLCEAPKLWDLATLRRLITLPGAGYWYIKAQFSPDGNTLVGLDGNGIANIWHAPTFAELEAAERAKAAPPASSP